MSGLRLAKRLQKLSFDKVVYAYFYAEDEMLFSAIRAGASGYVLKQ